jgi:hypothetical protein
MAARAAGPISPRQLVQRLVVALGQAAQEAGHVVRRAVCVLQPVPRDIVQTLQHAGNLSGQRCPDTGTE